MNQVATIEERIASKIDTGITDTLTISNDAGGATFANMAQVMEFAKLMSLSGVAVPKHLRTVPGACLGVVIQAIEWRMSPFAVANKSYSVNDRLAYEAQLIHAVVLQRAPIKGRVKVSYSGEGGSRVCKVWAELKDASGEIVEYSSPLFDRITPKNSPLWKTDTDQQLFYYSVRALARRHFPDVILGVYAVDEIEGEPRVMRDATPVPSRLAERLSASAPQQTSGFSQSFVEAEVASVIEGEAHQENTQTDANPPASQAAEATESDARSTDAEESSAANNSPAEKGEASSAEAEGAADSCSDAPAAPVEEDGVFADGARAARDGKSRKNAPLGIRNDANALARWQAGYDSEKGADQ